MNTDREQNAAAAVRAAACGPPVQVVDVASLPAAHEGGPQVHWSDSNQLQTNVVTLPALVHIAAHVEGQLDVTLVVLIGSLTLTHERDDEGCTAAVHAPAVVVLPAGTRRSLTAGPDGVTYLTAHRRRAGLLPQTR